MSLCRTWDISAPSRRICAMDPNQRSLRRKDQVSSNGIGGMNILAGGGDQVFRSSDHGATWQDFSKGFPKSIPAPAYVYPQLTCIIVFPVDTGGTILLAGTAENGVFRSSGCEASWKSTYTAGLKDYQCMHASSARMEQTVLISMPGLPEGRARHRVFPVNVMRNGS